MKTKYFEFTEKEIKLKTEVQKVRNKLEMTLWKDISKFLKTKGFTPSRIENGSIKGMVNKELKLSIDFSYIYSTYVHCMLTSNVTVMTQNISWYFGKSDFQTFYEKKLSKSKTFNHIKYY